MILTHIQCEKQCSRPWTPRVLNGVKNRPTIQIKYYHSLTYCPDLTRHISYYLVAPNLLSEGNTYLNFAVTNTVVFPGGSDGKASVYNAGDPGSILGLGRSPGGGNGNPLQDYCLENPMNRGAW